MNQRDQYHPGKHAQEIRSPHEKRVLNVAAVCPSTQALGPGNRAVVWVQGCPIHCPGCIAPDWIPIQPAHLVNPEELAEQLLQRPEVTGLTFSGGEPMLQAGALAFLARRARQIRDISIICFTGFRFPHLYANPPSIGVTELLNEVDVLIDGPYIASKNDNKGMRGSSNQRVYYLSDRLRAFDFEEMGRKSEIQIANGHAFLIGVPSTSLSDAFQSAVSQANRWQPGMV